MSVSEKQTVEIIKVLYRGADILILDEPTRGQAETVYEGIRGCNLSLDEAILIHNIDTFRPRCRFPESACEWDGYLECFEGSGPNWSYAKTGDGTKYSRVIETAEKKEISSFCSTGMYYFRKVSDFLYAYHENEKRPIGGLKEMYVAPLYNYLIEEGRNIHVDVIAREDVIFCGVPEEYSQFLKSVVE